MTNSAVRFVENAIMTVADLFDGQPTITERAAATRLIAALNEAKASSAFCGSEFWQQTCSELCRLAAVEDARYFLRWTPIAATMVHRANSETYGSWWRLRRSVDWAARWRPALRNTRYGHPPPFLPMPSTNPMAVEHAAHLQEFERRTGRCLYDTDCIIEFGGGFGSMCRLVHALGFKGRYIIFDLPPVHAIQRHYLTANGHSVDGDTGTIHMTAGLDDLQSLIDRFQPARIAAISTWALSEMPIGLRVQVLDLLKRSGPQAVLIAYQNGFEGTDNRDWFDGMARETSDIWTWTRVPIGRATANPRPEESAYLFGITRSAGIRDAKPPSVMAGDKAAA